MIDCNLYFFFKSVRCRYYFGRLWFVNFYLDTVTVLFLSPPLGEAEIYLRHLGGGKA